MSIRSLLTQGLIKGNSTGPATPVSDLSVAFALDSGYLMPFKVMLSSMASVGTLLDCPVVVYSDDEKVFDDPIVRLVVDKKVLLEGERREVLYGLARSSVGRQEKRGDWNRGTFLKWAIFEPQPTSSLLFLDVDMVVIRPLEEIVTLSPPAKFLAGPQFQTSLTKESPEIVYKELRPMIDGSDYPGRHSWRINSGVMLVRDHFLSDDFFAEISSFARKDVRVHEQAHLSDYFRDHPGHQMLPAAYNCQENWIRKLSGAHRAELLRSIKILHYAGPGKPWKKPPRMQASDARFYWHQAAKSGRSFVAIPKLSAAQRAKAPPASKDGLTKYQSKRPVSWRGRLRRLAGKLFQRLRGSDGSSR